MKQAKTINRSFLKDATQREIRKFLSCRGIRVSRNDMCVCAPKLSIVKTYGARGSNE